MKTLVIAGIAATTVAVLGYLFYFDQKRQADPKFKKKLKKLQKKAKKKQSLETISQEELERIASKVKSIKLPISPDELQKFFIEKLSTGEQLMNQGKDKYVESASEFFCAVQAHPSPVEFLSVLEESLPGPVFHLIIQLMAADSRIIARAYFDNFPSKDLGVSVKSSNDKSRKGLFLDKDVDIDDLIFVDEALLSCQEPSLPKDLFCEYCQMRLNRATSLRDEGSSGAWFCCITCKSQAKERYLDVMFGAQSAEFARLHEYCKQNNKIFPWLLAKFLLQMFYNEVSNDSKDANVSDWEHLERLPYLELEMTEENELELDLIANAVKTVNEALQAFLNKERFLILKGRFLYNLFSVPSFELPSIAKPVLDKSFAQVAKERASQPLITNETVDGAVTPFEDPEAATVPAPVDASATDIAVGASHPSYADIAKNKAVPEVVALEPTPAATPLPETEHKEKTALELDITHDSLCMRGAVEAENRVAAALYVVCCYIAHGEHPNCRLVFGKDGICVPGSGAKVAVVANKSLKKGEELFLSWIPDSITSHNRRKRYLEETWRL